MEICDGAQAMSCEEAGYFGGTTVCSNECALDTQECNPCAPTNQTCIIALIKKIDVAVSSGTRVAFGDGQFISIYDGASIAKTFPLDISGIVAVTNGWLVGTRDPDAIVPMASDGTLGTPQYAIAYDMAVAANRVLVTKLIGGQAYAEIRDESGVLVVPVFSLPVGWKYRPRVLATSSSFFVTEDGATVRIGLDGSQTMLPDFHGGWMVWGGTAGWSLGRVGVDDTYAVERFDEAGAVLGSFTVALGNVIDAIGDGDDLLVIRYQSTDPVSRLEVVRLDASGALGVPEPFGVGDTQNAMSDMNYSPAARLGDDLVVSWQDHDQTWVARIAPPQ
jgi:hypothetical protein